AQVPARLVVGDPAHRGLAAAERVLVGGPSGEEVARRTVLARRAAKGAPVTARLRGDEAREARRHVDERAAQVVPDPDRVDRPGARDEGAFEVARANELRHAVAVEVAEAVADALAGPDDEARRVPVSRGVAVDDGDG